MHHQPSPLVRRHTSHLTRLEAGELLPIVVDGDGVPPLLAHMYVLHRRSERLASSTLHKEMLRVAELYDAWPAVTGQPLDGFLLDGHFPDRRIIERVFVVASKDSVRSTAQKRCGSWSAFLRWIADEHNWWSVARGSPASQRLAERRSAAESIAARLAQLAGAMQAGEPREVCDLDERDLEALATVAGPGRHSASLDSSIFGEAVRLRNWLLYQLVRQLGLRIGEALALKVTSLARLSRRDMVARQFAAMRKAQTISIERIPDDPDNSRKRVSVKRSSRTVGIPDALTHLYWRYVDGSPPEGRPECDSPFLIVTEKGAPLSQDGAVEVLERMGTAAAQWYRKRWGSDSPALRLLHWHALRHYRAVESLPEFFPDNLDTPSRRAAFLDYFGWASVDSAMPYLRRLSERTGHAIANRDINR